MKTTTFSTSRTANPLRKNKVKRTVNGFTLLEVIIGGAIMATVMVAVARISITGIASSGQQASRSRIEAAINNNMQELQRINHLLTYESIESEGEEELETACSDPANYLTTKLENADASFPPDDIDTATREIIKLEDSSSIPPSGIAVVTYEFEGPETSVSTEKRVLEFYPNFQALCGLN